jgi:threonyl-tRNA synthetase
MLIAGEEDQKNRAVSFRFRDGSQKNGVPISQAIDEILQTIKMRQQV